MLRKWRRTRDTGAFVEGKFWPSSFFARFAASDWLKRPVAQARRDWLIERAWPLSSSKLLNFHIIMDKDQLNNYLLAACSLNLGPHRGKHGGTYVAQLICDLLWQKGNKEWMSEYRTWTGHHGSKRREMAQHAHSHKSHAFTHTLTSTQLQPHCAKRQLS